MSNATATASKPTMSTEVKAAMALIQGVAEAIRELGSVPSGHLYAAIMGSVPLNTYNNIIDILTKGGLVKKQGDVLTWAVAA